MRLESRPRLGNKRKQPPQRILSLHIVVRHPTEGEHGFSIDVPEEHLERVHSELLEHLRKFMRAK